MVGNPLGPSGVLLYEANDWTTRVCQPKVSGVHMHSPPRTQHSAHTQEQNNVFLLELKKDSTKVTASPFVEV